MAISRCSSTPSSKFGIEEARIQLQGKSAPDLHSNWSRVHTKPGNHEIKQDYVLIFTQTLQTWHDGYNREESAGSGGGMENPTKMQQILFSNRDLRNIQHQWNPEFFRVNLAHPAAVIYPFIKQISYGFIPIVLRQTSVLTSNSSSRNELLLNEHRMELALHNEEVHFQCK